MEGQHPFRNPPQEFHCHRQGGDPSPRDTQAGSRNLREGREETPAPARHCQARKVWIPETRSPGGRQAEETDPEDRGTQAGKGLTTATPGAHQQRPHPRPRAGGVLLTSARTGRHWMPSVPVTSTSWVGDPVADPRLGSPGACLLSWM